MLTDCSRCAGTTPCNPDHIQCGGVVRMSHCAGHCERNKGTRISKSCSVWYVCHTVLDIVNAIRGRGLVSHVQCGGMYITLCWTL